MKKKSSYKAVAFKSEKDVEDFIISNIDSFCSDVLKDKIVKVVRQKGLQESTRIPPIKQMTADIIIECVEKIYIIEIKHTNYKSCIRAAIGQILCYGATAGDRDKEHSLIILSSVVDQSVVKAISLYNLPIRFLLFQDDIISEVVYSSSKSIGE